MICEGSCDTEDWINDVFASEEYIIFYNIFQYKTVILNSTKYSCFTVFFIKYAALVSIKNIQSNPNIYIYIYIYIYAFSRRFYPKRLTVHSGYTFFGQYMYIYKHTYTVYISIQVPVFSAKPIFPDSIIS